MNKINKIILIILLVSQNIISQEKHFVKVKEYKTLTDSLFLFVAKDNLKKQSAIGFISRKQKKTNKKKSSIDTCFFYNIISKEPKHSFQNKIKLEKIQNNVWKYYLVYNEDCFSNKLPKDSIPLEGYFKILDKTKPSTDRVYELSIYDEIDKSGTNDNITLKSIPVESTTNSEGWFSHGLKNGEWIFEEPSFAKIEEHYKNGVRDGLYIVYGKNGRVLYQTSFKNGTGIEKIYRKNGNLYRIKYYKNGSLDDSKLLTLYYDNGNIAEEFDFQKNTRKSFYKDGNISRLDVDIIKNDKSRNIITQINIIKSYDRLGTVRERKYYENDNWIYTIFYDEKQKIKKIESGNMIQYFHKGKFKSIQFLE
ncbi:toxin-antitoxin system YwqK family antitoxin [Aquimarina muelleri]|uniref:toxin-antitoxin system YwqK family antitoxin n=1 Tax=Aquimarina muelleri TaxID=279356 RepID=UPI003F688B4B